MKKIKSKPVPVKLSTFDEVIKETTQKSLAVEEQWKEDGICTGKDCKNKSSIDLGTGNHLCQKCKKEIDRLLSSLRKNSGFFEGSVK